MARLASRLPAPEALVSFLVLVLPWTSVACEIAVVVPLVKGKFRDTGYDDVVLRRWCCFRRFDIPSNGGSSGVGVSVRRVPGKSPGSLPAVIGRPVIAVVGLALPVTDPPGLRDVIETFDDREPGRLGDCGCGLLKSGIVIGGGEIVSATPDWDSSCCSCGSTWNSWSSFVTSRGGSVIMIGSGVTSVGACAKSRESEEGPAEGIEFARDLAGKGRGAVNDSSTSGSAGTSNGSSISTGFVSVSIGGEATRLVYARLLEACVWVCWAQSSTSSI